jgi:hypothetical protein
MSIPRRIPSGIPGSITTAGGGPTTYNQSVAGVLAATGTVSRVGTFGKLNTGVFTSSGILTDAVTYSRVYSSTLAMAGTLVKRVFKNVGGILQTLGNVYKQMYVRITGVVTFSGSASGFPFTPSVSSFVTKGIRFMRKFIGRR